MNCYLWGLCPGERQPAGGGDPGPYLEPGCAVTWSSAEAGIEPASGLGVGGGQGEDIGVSHRLHAIYFAVGEFQPGPEGTCGLGQAEESASVVCAAASHGGNVAACGRPVKGGHTARRLVACPA